MNGNNISEGYKTIIAVYSIINFIILYKWITFDYENNYAGSLAAQLWGFSSLILNLIFFTSFIVAGVVKKEKRMLYMITAFFAAIPVGILIITG